LWFFGLHYLKNISYPYFKVIWSFASKMATTCKAPSTFNHLEFWSHSLFIHCSFSKYNEVILWAQHVPLLVTQNRLHTTSTEFGLMWEIYYKILGPNWMRVSLAISPEDRNRLLLNVVCLIAFRTRMVDEARKTNDVKRYVLPSEAYRIALITNLSPQGFRVFRSTHITNINYVPKHD